MNSSTISHFQLAHHHAYHQQLIVFIIEVFSTLLVSFRVVISQYAICGHCALYNTDDRRQWRRRGSRQYQRHG